MLSHLKYISPFSGIVPAEDMIYIDMERNILHLKHTFMKKETKKLKLNKIKVANLSANINVNPGKAPTIGDWTCIVTLRTCASIEFPCL
jgi:hypothetical protein